MIDFEPQAIIDTQWQFSNDIEKSRLAVDLTGRVTPKGVERLILQTSSGALQVHIPTNNLREFCESTLLHLDQRKD